MTGTLPRTRTVSRRALTASLVVLGVFPPGAALAQSSPPPGSIGAAVGLRWTGAMALGHADATETAPGGGRYRLFTTSTRLAPATGIDASLTVRMSRSIEIGVSSSFAQSSLRTRLTSDVEGIPDVEAIEDITQLTIEGAALLRLNWRPIARSSPFLTGGAGYLRQLHEGRTLIETGSVVHLGAGLDYLLQSDGRGALKATGVRADARVTLRSGGVADDDRSHLAPAYGVSFFARF